MTANPTSAPAAPEPTATPAKQAAAAKQSKASPSVAARIEAAIDDWWLEHIHNSPVSQATEAYAHIHKRLEALKASVVNALKEV